MIITYYGKQFVKISFGDLTLGFNPVSRGSKSGVSAHFGADIAFVSVNHPDYNGVDQLSHGDREPFVISGPGDYEVKQIFIKGVASNANLGGKKHINTIYSFELEGMKVAFLGALSEEDLSKDMREAVDSPDILFVPVTQKGGELLDPKSAAKVSSSLEPKLIIPVEYDNDSLKTFLKELGAENAEKVDKLTIKRKDLEGKEADVVVLSAGSN